MTWFGFVLIVGYIEATAFGFYLYVKECHG